MHRDVELLAIGGGPSNLALAVALEEMTPDDLATSSLVLERNRTVTWQEGLLLPWAKSQVSFLKDFVTLRDPCSRFSFLKYLHEAGRLDDFANMASFTPYRVEISGYLEWVANSLVKVRLETGRDCVSVEPRHDRSGRLTGWLTRLADESCISSRYLVVGAGRDPHIPAVFDGVGASKVVHSTRYRQGVAALADDPPQRVVVVGGAQSAAEMFHSLQTDLPGADVTWVMRSIGLNAYESSKFTNELFYPSFVDQFFEAPPEGRAQLLREMHRTNYSGIAPGLLETLYSDLYLHRLSDQDSRRIVTMVDITAVRERAEELVLELRDRRTGGVREVGADVVLLGTGFRRAMPAMVRTLAERLGLHSIEVSRHYRLLGTEPSTAACYLQGVNEATHGIADSLLSVLAHRSADIANDIVVHRRQGTPAVGNHSVPATTRPGEVPGRPDLPVRQPPGSGRQAAWS